MNVLHARPGSRFAGRRLSLPRTLLTVAAALALVGLTAAAVVAPRLLPATPGTPSDQRWFAGYYDVTLEDGAKLAQSTLGLTPGGVVLAFVVAAGEDDCTPTWGKAYDLDSAGATFELDRRVERLHRQGLPVSVSFGGAINTELALACEDTDALVDAYASVVERYGVDTIDLDIEGDAIADRDSRERRAEAVARLQEERPADDPLAVWLTLPVAPSGLTDEGVDLVAGMLAAGVEVAGVNAMTMNYGLEAPQSLADVNAGALEATAAQLADVWEAAEVALPSGGVWQLLGATPMIGRNDVPSEVFTIEDARALNEFATARGLARLSMWSLNRDHTCGSNYPNIGRVSTECSGIEQAGETFAAVLANGYTGTVDADAAAAEHPVVADDPDTSPYPVWSSTAYYSAGVKVVWNGSVYVSKWWNEGASAPDDPMLDVAGSAWTYVGPVLESDRPFALPQLPEGTYAEWSADALYNQGDRVMLDGTGYEARWWSRGQNPQRSVLDRDYSPWTLLTDSAAG